MKIKSTILKYDTLDENGRIYTKNVALQIISTFKEKPDQMLGELNQPDSSVINLKNVSHKITKLYLDENKKTLEAEIEILNTINGKLMTDLIKNDINWKLAPRGFGTINKKREIENYKLISIDIIKNKS